MRFYINQNCRNPLTTSAQQYRVSLLCYINPYLFRKWHFNFYILDYLWLIVIFWYLEETDFQKYANSYCTPSYQNENSLLIAISKCRDDENCSMVSATSCDDDMATYHLCRKDAELISSNKACHYLKKGKLIKTQQI